MSLAIDTIDEMIKAWIERTNGAPWGIHEIDYAVGRKLEVMKEVREAVMKAEAKRLEESPPLQAAARANDRLRALRDRVESCKTPCERYGHEFQTYGPEGREYVQCGICDHIEAATYHDYQCDCNGDGDCELYK